MIVPPSHAAKTSSKRNGLSLYSDPRELAVFRYEMCAALDQACVLWVMAAGQRRSVWDLAKQPKRS